VIGIASGIILGALITYYLLKDGKQLRRAVVAAFDNDLRHDVDAFIGDSCRILRDYGKGRNVMSAIVSLFIGLVALGDGGIAQAAVMLAAVLASNLILENFVEPKVMGRSLDIHPLIVLIVTALGGLIGGIVGLILAVPAYVVARSAITRFRHRGLADRVADRAQPAVQCLLD